MEHDRREQSRATTGGADDNSIPRQLGQQRPIPFAPDASLRDVFDGISRRSLYSRDVGVRRVSSTFRTARAAHYSSRQGDLRRGASYPGKKYDGLSTYAVCG